MKVIVIGGGKVGYYLAKTLLEHGHAPTLVEKRRENCAKLANDLDIPVICGDGTTLEGLMAAEAMDAAALVAVTGKDQENLIACQLAKNNFGIKKTIARVNNPKNVDVMKRLGVDIPISSTNNISRLLEHEIDTATIKQLMTINHGEASIVEIIIPKKYKNEGIKLMDLNIPDETVVVSIIRNEKIIIPRGNTTIRIDDKVILFCKEAEHHNISKLFSLE